MCRSYEAAKGWHYAHHWRRSSGHSDCRVIAGWLAGKIVEGSGFGLIGDMAVGIVGALIGSWLMPRLGIHLASGMLSAIIVATIGAVLLVIVKLVTGGFPASVMALLKNWRL
jgi:uncharacterized membrane protein YeaQ/YmgE (transglycosylase-associated protein family)